MADEKKPAEKPAKKEEKPPEEKAKKKADGKGKQPEKKEEKTETGGIKNRVRVAGVILDGSLDIQRALTGIKGVGPQIAGFLPRILGINEKEKLGNLTEKQIHDIEATLQDLDKHFPVWMLNRRGDMASGSNKHPTGPDLEMANREDKNLMKRTRSYKGVRHSLNLPCRGQRTRSSFRKGTTLGVSRKKNQPKSAQKDKK